MKGWIKRAHLVTIDMDLHTMQQLSLQRQERLHREFLVRMTPLAKRRKRPWNPNLKFQFRKVLQLMRTLILNAVNPKHPELEEEHVELEDRSNEADDEDENVEEVMNAYMEEVAEFQTEDERKAIREALGEAKRFLEIEKTTHEIELQEALEKETEQVAGDDEKKEDATDAVMGAVLPDSGRTVTPDDVTVHAQVDRTHGDWSIINEEGRACQVHRDC